MSQTIKTRVKHKHAVERDWEKAINFAPLAGELIIYDPDSTHAYPRVKVGDGTTLVNALPFFGGDHAREILSDVQPVGLDAGDTWLKPI